MDIFWEAPKAREIDLFNWFFLYLNSHHSSESNFRQVRRIPLFFHDSFEAFWNVIRMYRDSLNEKYRDTDVLELRRKNFPPNEDIQQKSDRGRTCDVHL